MVWRSQKIKDIAGQEPAKDFRPALAVFIAVGLVVGTLKGMFGFGGGIVFAPFLILYARFTPQMAAGSSLGVVLLSSLFGSVPYAFSQNVDIKIVGLLFAGSIFGIFAGTELCTRLEAKRLSKIFSFGIVGFAIFLLANLVFQLANQT